MELEQRIEKLQQGIQNVGERLSKVNSCHVKSGPQGGQFCETKGDGSGGGGVLTNAKSALSANGFKSRGFGNEFFHQPTNHTVYVNERRGTFEHTGVGGAVFGSGKLSDLPSHLKTWKKG